MNTSDILSAYRDAGSEKAFSDLVQRYTNLVFSVAKRRLGDNTLAEDATQTVFARLARSQPKVKSDGELSAWLHRTTVHVAIDLWRSETRRRAREQQAAAMQSIPDEDTRIWEELAPHLDQALDELDDSDRQAVLLRFYARKPMREVGHAFGISEDAAKMRVSRAIDRLRDKLSVRGIVCPMLVLTALLFKNSVEAAPGHLLAALNSIRFAAPAAAGTTGGWLLLLAKWKTLFGVAAATIAIGLLIGFAESKNARPRAGVVSENVQDAVAERQRELVPQFIRTEPAPANRTARAIIQAERGLPFRVLDRVTGAGLANVKITAVYFYAGGIPEGHDLQTDQDGNARIPEANKPNATPGFNVFVRLEGYVPKAFQVDRINTESRVLELDPAVSLGGIVVDEEGLPVPNVELKAMRNRREEYQKDSPNTDFQMTLVTNNADGRWIFPYAPADYESIEFYLTCTNYAVTQVNVPVGRPDSSNVRLVIKRGVTVAGRVTDTLGQPVVGATVRELHLFAHRKLSATTDADGTFILKGLSKDDEPTAELVVEAEGMAPQLRKIELSEPMQNADFVLRPGNIFRGRVVDQDGNPVSEVCVQTDWNFEKQIPTRFEWRTHTDAAGRFEWDSAPENEEVCFWFEADGYEIIRGRPLATDGREHEIRISKSR